MLAWSNWVSKFRIMAALAVPIALLGAPSPLSAEEPQGSQRQQQPLTQQELQQLVAPIALYPDALLAQVLTASTYPLEVTLAARWSEKNPKLKGEALEEAIQKQPWDPSVKGLASVPQVLAMMNEKLEWTSQLGEAFLAQPDDVQNAIQTLRKQAETTGNLKSSKEQKVRRVAASPSASYVGPPEYIVIEPVDPDYIYVPVYDPLVVYGSDYWSPAYAPFFWYPPWWTIGPAFGFGAAHFVGPALWYQYNWGHGGFAAIQTNTVLYNKFNKVKFTGDKSWRFDPAHHGNVQFKNPKLQQQFSKPGGKDVQRIDSQRSQGVQTRQRSQGVQTRQRSQGVQTRQRSQGVQTRQRSQGVQTRQRSQGVQTRQRSQGVQTRQRSQGVQTRQRSQGVQTRQRSQGVQTRQRSQGVQTRQRSQGVQTRQRSQGVQTRQRSQGVQTRQRSQGVQTRQRSQGVQGGGGGQGGGRGGGQGGGRGRH